jgi:hypothetical protein
MKLSNVIYNISSRYKLPKRVFTAIIAQESMFKMGAKNTKRGFIKKDLLTLRLEYNLCIEMMSISDCKKFMSSPMTHYQEIEILTDVGVTQIHTSNIKKFGFDIDKLLTDMEYSVEAGAIILSRIKKRWQRKEPLNYWSRYNSSTPIKREQYQQLVERWM